MPFYRFAYPTTLREGEEPRPFRTRDGAAFGELSAVLTGLGWEYGSLIYNCADDPSGSHTLGREHFSFLGPEDCIVLTTRPPLRDPRHGDKKRVARSYTHLENSIFKEFETFLEVCARSHIRLTSRIAGSSEKADFKFRQTKDARLVAYNSLSHDKRETLVSEDLYRTVGFFLWKDRIIEYNCALLACFGMGGVETLIWNRVVRTRFSHWLQRSAFVVAELDIGVLPSRPSTLSFVEQVGVTILLDIPLSTG